MNLTLADFGVTRKVDSLSNGIRLVTFEKKGLPVILRAAILAGSRFDSPGKEGTAHFLEHMIVAGSEKYPTKDRLATFIERLGGVFGGSTGDSRMKVDVEIGDPADLPAAAEVLAEILCHPLFSPVTLESERGSVLQELAKKTHSPTSYLGEVRSKLFYQGTELGRVEKPEILKSITLDDITAFYKSHFSTGRVVIVAAGEVEIERLKDELEKRISLPAGDKVTIEGELPFIREKVIQVGHFSAADQIRFVIGWRAVSLFDPEIRALRMIGVILGGGRAGVLERLLRYERGLVYSTRAGNSAGVDDGFWEVESATAKENLAEVLGIIGQEIDRVRSGGLTEEEVSFAKDKMIKSERRFSQTAESWVNFHTAGELFRPETYATLDQELNEIAKLTKKDLDLVSAKYLTSDRWYLAATGAIDEDEIKFNF